MARQRMLHPDYFTDADLLSLSPLHRLLFAGLWCHADRDGRMLDKPKNLKLRILPGDDCDVDAMLNDLAGLRMVRRYSADGIQCIEISAFSKHQRPHPKEAPGALPTPPAVELHGEPRNYPASRVAAGSMTVLPSESVTESDSKTESESEEESFALSATPTPALPAELQRLWNDNADPSLPRWEEMPEKRRRQVALRLRDRDLDGWRDVIHRINDSKFCCGNNDRGWKASPDWLLRPDTAAKVLEGNYDGAATQARHDPNEGILRGAS